MYKGTVTFQAAIKGNGINFPTCTFCVKDTEVEKVEIEGDGHEIRGSVFMKAISDREAGKAVATRIFTTALDRLSFHYNVAIEPARILECQFSPLNPSPNTLTVDTGEYVIVGEAVTLSLGFPAEVIKKQLEEPGPRAEQHFSLFRSARLSSSPVEEFMHLYNLLFMFLGDSQRAVDDFILKQEPSTPTTPSLSPRGKQGEIETIYTRLRNELGHSRPGVNLLETKKEMAARVGELAVLTKKAIELYG
jgi:hypothetical protein